MTKYLYSFYWNYGRQGCLEGLFVATEKEVEDLIDSYAHFGEVLGKHSEVEGDIKEGDIRKLDVSPEAVEQVAKALGESWSGFDPREFVYVECYQCGDSMSVQDWTCEYREDYGQKICEECYKDLKELEEIHGGVE